MTANSSGPTIFIIQMMDMEVRSMALCNEACCNSQKREEEYQQREEAKFKARLGFARAMAQHRGQTVDRVIPAGPTDPAFVRPVESDNIESEESAPSALQCNCTDCPCTSMRTVTHPQRCSECLKGWHVRPMDG